jgi:hypothetical protein
MTIGDYCVEGNGKDVVGNAGEFAVCMYCPDVKPTGDVFGDGAGDKVAHHDGGMVLGVIIDGEGVAEGNVAGDAVKKREALDEKNRYRA